MMTRRGLAAMMLAVAGALAPLSPIVHAQAAPPVTRSAHRAMNAIIPIVQIKDQPLSAVLAKLQEVSGCNMRVEWKTLEDAGVTKDTKISISLSEVGFSDALDAVLQQAGAKSKLLAYADGYIIHISTQAEADTHLILTTYRVQDLTMASVHLIAPQGGNGINGLNNNNQTGTNTTNVLGQNTNNNNQNNNNNNNNNNGQNTQQQTQQQIQQAQLQAGAQLVALVKSMVRPDIWSDDKGGGGPATVVYYNGSLVVKAPIYVLEAIGGPVAGH